MRFEVSPQMFAVMAAVHVAASDASEQKQSPVHRLLHDRLAGISPELREKIGKFCAAQDSELTLARLQSKYVSLALLLNGPPAFAPVLKSADAPADVQPLLGFESLIGELWREADLAGLWAKVRPQYILEIEAYRPLIRDMIIETLRFMRTEARISLDRQVTFIPELLISGGVVNARNVGHTYIVVVGSTQGTERPMRSIRHEYLHFLLDPFLAKYVAYLPPEEPFQKRVNEQPGALRRYRQSFYLMVTESLLEMVEVSLDRLPPDRRVEAILDAYDRGLILAPYFAERFLKFEKETAPLPEVFRGMIEGIRWDSESGRDADIARLRADAAAKRPASETVTESRFDTRQLLNDANRLLQSRDFAMAGELLEKILEVEPENANALFGLAQVHGQRQELEQALQLYGKAARCAGEETWIAAWSHVRRGNIYRSQEDFEKAKAEWSQVLQLQGNLRGATEAARKALSEPTP